MLKSITSLSSSSQSLAVVFNITKQSLTRCLSFPSCSSSPSPNPISLFTIKKNPMSSLLGRFGFGFGFGPKSTNDPSIETPKAQDPDDDLPGPGREYAQFGAGCFWGVELAFQRVDGVCKTEVGYSQGCIENPTYEDICTGLSNHSEVVRVEYDTKECSFHTLLDVFWSRHDPTTLNRQGNDVGTQYRSGIYFYTPEQEKAALDSKDNQQKLVKRTIVTEIMPAKKLYRGEEYHQQYLAKGGRFGFRQSAQKGCNDPIRCYG